MSVSSEKMSPAELRATIGLAGVYGLRMFGLFIILPVFAFYAEDLPGGDNYTLIGIALGAYGLTQAILQIPFGWLSDRIGRKPVIYIGLILFALGSLIAAFAADIYWIIIGRIVQGAGAISAAVMALAADLTREEHRTKAMATIGMTIGMVFALSLAIAPTLNQWIGVPGIFAMTGIFALHATLMALWLVVPLTLREAGLVANDHWQIYLPVLLLSVVCIIPPIIYAEKKAKLKPVFIIAIGILLLGQILLSFTTDSIMATAAALWVFFTAFNLLEASLPSLISKIAPVGAKGTAIGIYRSTRFLGAFAGASIGGYLFGYYGSSALYGFCGLLLVIWILLAITMKAPAAVRSKMYSVHSDMDLNQSKELSRRLAELPGVFEALVLVNEKIAYLKVDMKGFDETNVIKLLEEGVK